MTENLQENFKLDDKVSSSSSVSVPPRDSTKIVVHSQDNLASYSLNGLQPETKYKVCVKSYNKWGWSILSDTVVIATNNVVDVTPSQELSDKGKNKTNELNYAGPDPLLLQPEVSNSSDPPSTLYIAALLLYLFF